MAKAFGKKKASRGFVPMKFVREGEAEITECVNVSPKEIKGNKDEEYKPISVYGGHELMAKKYQDHEKFKEKGDIPKTHQLYVEFHGKRPERHEIETFHPDIVDVLEARRNGKFCFLVFPSEEAALRAKPVLATKKVNGRWLKVEQRNEGKQSAFPLKFRAESLKAQKNRMRSLRRLQRKLEGKVEDSKGTPEQMQIAENEGD